MLVHLATRKPWSELGGSAATARFYGPVKYLIGRRLWAPAARSRTMVRAPGATSRKEQNEQTDFVPTNNSQAVGYFFVLHGSITR